MRDNRDKEKAVEEFREMIRQSWTYGRLTTEERARWEALFDDGCGGESMVKGNYYSRFMALANIYHAFMAGIGYTGGWEWREAQEGKNGKL